MEEATPRKREENTASCREDAHGKAKLNHGEDVIYILLSATDFLPYSMCDIIALLSENILY